jgi:hypothetical protein
VHVVDGKSAITDNSEAGIDLIVAKHGGVSLSSENWKLRRVLVTLPLQRGSCSEWVYKIVGWGLIKLRVYIVAD